MCALTDKQPAYSFGAHLKSLRKALDLTQVELAQRTSCSPVTIKKLEADALRPSKQMAERLAECLGIMHSERAYFLHMARAGDPRHEAYGGADMPVLRLP